MDTLKTHTNLGLVDDLADILSSLSPLAGGLFEGNQSIDHSVKGSTPLEENLPYSGQGTPSDVDTAGFASSLAAMVNKTQLSTLVGQELSHPEGRPSMYSSFYHRDNIRAGDRRHSSGSLIEEDTLHIKPITTDRSTLNLSDNLNSMLEPQYFESGVSRLASRNSVASVGSTSNVLSVDATENGGSRSRPISGNFGDLFKNADSLLSAESILHGSSDSRHSTGSSEAHKTLGVSLSIPEEHAVDCDASISLPSPTAGSVSLAISSPSAAGVAQKWSRRTSVTLSSTLAGPSLTNSGPNNLNPLLQNPTNSSDHNNGTSNRSPVLSSSVVDSSTILSSDITTFAPPSPSSLLSSQFNSQPATLPVTRKSSILSTHSASGSGRNSVGATSRPKLSHIRSVRNSSFSSSKYPSSRAAPGSSSIYIDTELDALASYSSDEESEERAPGQVPLEAGDIAMLGLARFFSKLSDSFEAGIQNNPNHSTVVSLIPFTADDLAVLAYLLETVHASMGHPLLYHTDSFGPDGIPSMDNHTSNLSTNLPQSSSGRNSILATGTPHVERNASVINSVNLSSSSGILSSGDVSVSNVSSRTNSIDHVIGPSHIIAGAAPELLTRLSSRSEYVFPREREVPQGRAESGEDPSRINAIPSGLLSPPPAVNSSLSASSPTPTITTSRLLSTNNINLNFLPQPVVATPPVSPPLSSSTIDPVVENLQYLSGSSTNNVSIQDSAEDSSHGLQRPSGVNKRPSFVGNTQASHVSDAISTTSPPFVSHLHVSTGNSGVDGNGAHTKIHDFGSAIPSYQITNHIVHKSQGMGTPTTPQATVHSLLPVPSQHQVHGQLSTSHSFYAHPHPYALSHTHSLIGRASFAHPTPPLHPTSTLSHPFPTGELNLDSASQVPSNTPLSTPIVGGAPSSGQSFHPPAATATTAEVSGLSSAANAGNASTLSHTYSATSLASPSASMGGYPSSLPFLRRLPSALSAIALARHRESGIINSRRALSGAGPAGLHISGVDGTTVGSEGAGSLDASPAVVPTATAEGAPEASLSARKSHKSQRRLLRQNMKVRASSELEQAFASNPLFFSDADTRDYVESLVFPRLNANVNRMKAVQNASSAIAHLQKAARRRRASMAEEGLDLVSLVATNPSLNTGLGSVVATANNSADAGFKPDPVPGTGMETAAKSTEKKSLRATILGAKPLLSKALTHAGYGASATAIPPKLPFLVQKDRIGVKDELDVSDASSVRDSPRETAPVNSNTYKEGPNVAGKRAPIAGQLIVDTVAQAAAQLQEMGSDVAPPKAGILSDLRTNSSNCTPASGIDASAAHAHAHAATSAIVPAPVSVQAPVVAAVTSGRRDSLKVSQSFPSISVSSLPASASPDVTNTTGAADAHVRGSLGSDIAPHKRPSSLEVTPASTSTTSTQSGLVTGPSVVQPQEVPIATATAVAASIHQLFPIVEESFRWDRTVIGSTKELMELISKASGAAALSSGSSVVPTSSSPLNSQKPLLVSDSCGEKITDPSSGLSPVERAALLLKDLLWLSPAAVAVTTDHPDEKLPVPEPVAHSLEFTSSGLGSEILVLQATYAAQSLGLLSGLNVPLCDFVALLSVLARGYDGNQAYHNALHGADVTQAVFHLLHDPKRALARAVSASAAVPRSRSSTLSASDAKDLRRVSSSESVTSISGQHGEFAAASGGGLAAHLDLETQLTVILAAAAHDVGHPGVNNAFLVATGHPIALVYNDSSPLENMHVARLFLSLRRSGCDVFSSLTVMSRAKNRALLMALILGTDNALHFKHLDRLRKRLMKAAPCDSDSDSSDSSDSSGSSQSTQCEARRDSTKKCCPIDLTDDTDKKIILTSLLHACDIGNPARGWEESQLWSSLVRHEFFTQGDLMERAGLPVPPMFIRGSNLTSLKMSAGFMSALVLPLWNALDDEALHEIVNVSAVVGNLRRNVNRFKELIEAHEKVISAIKKN